MFFNDISDIEKISSRTGCAVFVMPTDIEIPIKNAYILQPDEKNIITIDQVKTAISMLNKKQNTDFFVIVCPAELIGDDAANAFLKNLEEPKEKVHFILQTSSPSLLLPTILSRAEVYVLKKPVDIDGPLDASPEIVALAKRLIIAKPVDLPVIADEISKRKDNVRSFALTVVGTTIEMLYKSYFKTGKVAFLDRVPRFLTLYDNLEKNGHIKLHLVADLC